MARKKQHDVPSQDADRTALDRPPAALRQMTAEEIVRRDPDLVRDYLAQRETPSGVAALQRFCDVVIEGVDKGNTKLVRLYAHMMKLAGGQAMIVNNFIREVGATPERARTGVTLLDKVEGLNEDDVAAIVEPFLRTYYARRGRKLLIVKESDQT